MTRNPARQQNMAGSRVHGDEPMTHASDQKDQQPAAERPTKFTNEIGEIICDRIIDDETLHSICSDARMPEMATVALWLANNAEFRDRYACVRALQAYGILDETIELVDEVSIEPVEKVRANGRAVRAPDRKGLPRCRLRCEARDLVADALLARARQLSPSNPIANL
jgi:hypothetical protein